MLSNNTALAMKLRNNDAIDVIWNRFYLAYSKDLFFYIFLYACSFGSVFSN